MGGSRLPACVGEELVQGLRPASTTLPTWRQLEEGCCEDSLRCNSEDAAPSHDPRCPGSSPERGRHLRCARSRQQADEGGGFGSPPAAYFHPEHHQAAAARPLQLGISLALFAACSLGKNDAGAGIGAGAGLAVPAEGADERGINCELLPMPKGQPVADNLNPPCVLHGHIEVHVGQPHVSGHTRASLATDPGEGSLKRDGARGKDASSGTRRPVVTQHIQRPSAERERQAQPRRRRRSRKCALGSVTSSCVGRTVRAREECGPACDLFILGLLQESRQVFLGVVLGARTTGLPAKIR